MQDLSFDVHPEAERRPPLFDGVQAEGLSPVAQALRSDMPDEALVLVGEARREAIKTIKRRHYTRSVPSGKSHYMRFRDALVVWSIPANNNIARFVLGWDGGVVWELSRLWAPDGHEKNLLTRAISHAVKRLVELERPDAVVSYADPNVGHLGGMYRAASWVDHGQSDESRAYRSAEGKILARRAFHSGPSTLSKAEIEQLGYAELNLPGKHRFVRFLSRQARRKAPPAVVGPPVDNAEHLRVPTCSGAPARGG